MNTAKLFVAIIAISLSTFVSGQAQGVEKSIREIRQEYNLIKSQISTLQKDGYAGKLYCLQTTDNKYGKSYPAVGEYRAETFFYYDKDADFPPCLRMVVQNVKSAGKKVYFEALYSENGEILFVFEQNEYSNNIAKRLYYNEGEIIRYTENNVEKKLDGNVIQISRAAKAHKTRFDVFLQDIYLSGKDKKKFLGSWKEESDNPHTAFTLDFSTNDEDEISASYYDGGPFEVYFTCRFIASNRVDLYFNYIAGSIVFNEIIDADVMNQDKNNKVKIIECEWINENEIRINTFDKERRSGVREANNLSLFKVE